MTSEGLGEMFEGDSADMCAEKFPLVSIGGRAEGLACEDPEGMTPIGASENCLSSSCISSRVIGPLASTIGGRGAAFHHLASHCRTHIQV